MDTFTQLNLIDISPNPYQPRHEFNTEELQELAQSIKENGLIQPIIVRQSSVFGYELIAGERRFRAAKLAGLKEIPAIVKQMTDQDSMKQAIIENLQRSNLNPIEEAKAYKQLLDRLALTHDELAQSMGKSRPYISNSLRLLQLPALIQDKIASGQLSQGHARLLMNLTEKEQLNYTDKIQAEELSVRQLEKILKSDSHLHKKNKQNPDIFIKDVEKELSRSLGLTVKLTYNKNHQGQISLKFSSEEEYTRLINRLK